MKDFVTILLIIHMDVIRFLHVGVLTFDLLLGAISMMS